MSRKRGNESDLPKPEPKRISKSSEKASTSCQGREEMNLTLKRWDSRLRELWIEALGVSPQVIIDDFINVANEQMYMMLSKIEMFVSKFIPEGSIVEEKMTEIDVLLEAAVDKHFDVFESIVKEQIFHFTSEEPVVPFHYEALLSDNQDQEIEDLIQQLKEEHKKTKQAEMFAILANQLQKKYQNGLTEFQETIDKQKLIDTQVNEKDMSVLRMNLSYFLNEFQRIFEVYACSAEFLKRPPAMHYTQRDLYVQQSLLSSIKDTLRFTKETPFTTLQLTSDVKTMKEKPWTDFSRALED